MVRKFKQLKKLNLKFTKPFYDLMIDDKSLFYKKNWSTEINKYLQKDNHDKKNLNYWWRRLCWFSIS